MKKSVYSKILVCAENAPCANKALSFLGTELKGTSSGSAIRVKK
ncbi:MAG: hypothetical protein V3U12_04700 [Nitrosopumilaceae archaeon]